MGSIDEDMSALVDNMIQKDRTGQFVVSTARYLNAIDKEKYAPSIDLLVKAAIDKVKEALKGGDNDAIKKATEELQKPLYEMSAAAYQQAQQAAGAAGGAADAGAQQAAQEEPKKADDNVVDAEYTEVKDK